MNVKQKKEQIQRLLRSVYSRHQQWKQAQEKGLSQLQSMSNLAEQLSTLRRCSDSGRLGSLSGYPHLVALLEAKIISSFERALGYLHKVSETLAELSVHLKSDWKEAERLLLDIAAQQGLEAVIECTHESHSISDVTEWLRLLNASHLYDLTEKQASLCNISCTPDSVGQAYMVWGKQPNGLADVLDCICYTVAYIKTTANS